VIGGYGAGIRLADLDGDGRDDYISVGPNGEAVAYLNGGANGDTWAWTYVCFTSLYSTLTRADYSKQGEIAIGVGAKRHQVQFADMNGNVPSSILPAPLY
jgi:hypothetical protein